jgi:hypothetical protein
MLRKEQQMMDDVTCYQDIPTEKEYIEVLWERIHKGAHKSLAFPICSITKIIFLDVINKFEQRSQKCVEVRGEYVNTFFQSRSLLFSL